MTETVVQKQIKANTDPTMTKITGTIGGFVKT